MKKQWRKQGPVGLRPVRERSIIRSELSGQSLIYGNEKAEIPKKNRTTKKFQRPEPTPTAANQFIYGQITKHPYTEIIPYKI